MCLQGNGPLNSKALILSQAPSRFDDLNGVTLAGSQAKILNQALAEVGLHRATMRATNLVRCLPPGDRPPTAAEQRACRPYLDSELEASGATHVLLLGAVPLRAVTTGAKLPKQLRGRPFTHAGKTYLPTFHPNYIVRSPRARSQLISDLRLFKSLIDGTHKEERLSIEYVTLDNFTTFLSYLQGVVSLDIETTSLYPWAEDAKIVSIGVGTRQAQYIWPINYPSHPLWSYTSPRVKQLMVQKLVQALRICEVATQFGKFDSLFFKVIYDVNIIPDIDTGLMHYSIDENSPHDLEYLSQSYYGTPAYDVPLETKHGKDGDIVKHATYLAKDLKYTRKLCFDIRKDLDNQPSSRKIYDTLTFPVSKIYRQIELNGVPIDVPRMGEVKTHLENQIQESTSALDKIVPGVNWASHKQVAVALFDTLELPSLKATKKGGDSADESVLLQIDHPVATALLKHRRAKKLLGTYIKGWGPYLVGGRIHPTFKIHGTVTSRPSCEHPNIQQTDRDPIIRSLIASDDLDWEIVEVDLSQAELRITAHCSGDKRMKRIFQEGGDIHSVTASEILEIAINLITSEQRFIAKSLNFGLIYGMFWKKLIIYARDNYGVHLTPRQAQDFRNRFFRLYASLLPWHERTRKFVRANGWVRNLSGRVRRLPLAQLQYDSPERGEAERQAINSPIQSFVSDMVLSSLIMADQEFTLDNVRIIATVHDSVLAQVHKSYIPEYAEKMSSFITHPFILDEWRIKLDVPMVADVKIGPWSKGISLEKWMQQSQKGKDF